MESKSLIEALVDVQRELKNPPLDGFNPHFKSKFSTLLAVRDTVIPVMNRHGIAVTQCFGIHDAGGAFLRTTLAKGKDQLCSDAIIPQSANIQGWAASATYIRRVSLLAIAGVVGDPDADAEDVVRPAERPQDHAPHPGLAIAADPAEGYASAFRSCLKTGNELGVFQTNLDLHNEGKALYTAVWRMLSEPDRVAIKAIIAAHKEPEKVTF